MSNVNAQSAIPTGYQGGDSTGGAMDAAVSPSSREQALDKANSFASISPAAQLSNTNSFEGNLERHAANAENRAIRNQQYGYDKDFSKLVAEGGKFSDLDTLGQPEANTTAAYSPNSVESTLLAFQETDNQSEQYFYGAADSSADAEKEGA